MFDPSVESEMGRQRKGQKREALNENEASMPQ